MSSNISNASAQDTMSQCSTSEHCVIEVNNTDSEEIDSPLAKQAKRIREAKEKKIRIEKVRKELGIGPYRQIQLNDFRSDFEYSEPLTIIEKPVKPLIVHPISNFTITKPQNKVAFDYVRKES